MARLRADPRSRRDRGLRPHGGGTQRIHGAWLRGVPRHRSRTAGPCRPHGRLRSRSEGLRRQAPGGIRGPVSAHPRDAVILGYVRTPFGRYGGGLAPIRPDDLASHVIRAVLERTDVADADIDEVVFGAADQSGEDNRNVGRMASLLAGLPETVPGVTVNRLCGSGLEAVNDAARRIRAGEADVVVAGGVESMTRAPLVTPKPSEAFPRGERTLADTTLGWRLTNPRMIDLGYHPISLGETAENVCVREKVAREAQDRYALRSQQRYAKSKADGFFAGEIQSVHNGKELVAEDEHPRPDVTLEKLAKLKPAFKDGGTVTAGNSSGVNDGAAALLVMSRIKAKQLGLPALGRVVEIGRASCRERGGRGV